MSDKGSKNAVPGKGPGEFSKPEKRVTLNTRPDPIAIDLHRTAVIVVDMQNAFVSKGDPAERLLATISDCRPG